MPAKPVPAADGHRSDSWNLSPGDEVVPHGIMQSLLGGGLRHEVYAAFDERLLAPVVVKIVRPSLVKDASALRATRREIDVLTRLGHPVVVRILDSMSSGPRPHLSMERVSGRTLSKVVHRDGALGPERATELGVALASALHFAHLRGFVHLDVKPGNVILGRPPRLIDFGIAGPLEWAGRISSPSGTPQYAAPEQCDPQGLGAPGPPADVWGLGVTLYETVTGALPFPNPGRDATAPLEEQYPQLALAPRAMPASTPGDVTRIVLACLRREPADRPTAAELFHALAALVGRDPDPAVGAQGT